MRNGFIKMFGSRKGDEKSNFVLRDKSKCIEVKNFWKWPKLAHLIHFNEYCQLSVKLWRGWHYSVYYGLVHLSVQKGRDIKYESVPHLFRPLRVANLIVPTKFNQLFWTGRSEMLQTKSEFDHRLRSVVIKVKMFCCSSISSAVFMMRWWCWIL